MKLKLVVLLLLVQWGTSLLFAQETLNGVVVSENEKGKRIPIPFANVYWQETNYGTSTDTNGVFQLAIPEERSNLIVSYIGFKSDTLQVIDLNKPLSVLLIPTNTNLGEVEVEYRRRGSELSFINPIQTTNMNEKELFKAACCNLSESFETNPSVDVNFTDAITGTRQIKMLGLNGRYTMINRENMPGVRGVANAFGLSFIPGHWVESIQVSKGLGSIVNGYESIAGQINIELQKPDLGEMSLFNIYANQAGRLESNFCHTEQLNEFVGTTLLLHGSTRPFERDVNGDGFRDFPLQQQINVMNRWKFTSNKGWMGQIALHYINDDKDGGQMDDLLEENQTSNDFRLYRLNIESESAELFGKVGYLFPEFKYKSFGFLWSLKNHEQRSNFGNRIYNITQKSGYANFIYQSIISNTNHQFKTGASFVYDEFDEQFEQQNFDRVERIPGAFFEYTYKPNNLFTLVAGVRGDHHNIYGGFVSPRVHLRYALNESTVFRALAGSGQRSPTVLVDNQSMMASSRAFLFPISTSEGIYGLEMEKAWNMGVNLTKSFTLDYREGTFQLDFYRTVFENQVVVDRDFGSQFLVISNLEGTSRSNTAQLQLDYELLKFLDMRIAYRWVDVKLSNSIGFEQNVFTPEHRFFINFGYETVTSNKESNWLFDLTMQWFGEQRIPSTSGNTETNRRPLTSPQFILFNGQVTRNLNKRWAIYIGIENALNYRQDDPIIAADNPFGNEFDASMIWGPVFGRMTYGGLRWKLEKE